MRISIMKNPESSPYCNIAHWTIFSRKMENLAIQLITRFYNTVGVATDFASRMRLVHRGLSAAWRLAEFANIIFLIADPINLYIAKVGGRGKAWGQGCRIKLISISLTQ